MKILSSLIVAALFAQVSIYSFVVPAINGDAINLDNLRGKKILLVNIATGSDQVGQLRELQQLQEQYPDSLVIIGFPSNSFGKEGRSNATIKSFCEVQYGVHFLLAAKASVKGLDIQPVYSWLAHAADNGTVDMIIKDDFQKILIDGNGEIAGWFSGSTSPLSPEMIATINQHR